MIRFRRILVPHDFSESATRALELAADLVPPGGRLVVLHVVVPFVPVANIPPAGFGGYITPLEFVSGARQQLDETIVRALGARRAARVERKVVVGDPCQRIVAAARGMDAIVMATAGRTGLSHLVIGSVAEKVVRHNPIPVLTLRGVARRKAATRSAKKAA
jgi:nucleotide-binding universal stress UspA family protein